jgi:hypothetical protein
MIYFILVKDTVSAAEQRGQEFYLSPVGLENSAKDQRPRYFFQSHET